MSILYDLPKKKILSVGSSGMLFFTKLDTSTEAVT